MDLANLLTKLLIALVCAGVATILIPREIPGQLAGLILIGLAGVWVGEWSYLLVRGRFGLDSSLLHWQIQGVLIIPAIVGCMVVLYLVTTVVRWWRRST